MKLHSLFFLTVSAAVILIVFLGATTMRKTVKANLFDVEKKLELAAVRQRVSLKNIRLTDDNNLQAEVKNITIIFSCEKSVDEQIASLQKLLKSSTINSNTRQIDFRFNKIVVK